MPLIRVPLVPDEARNPNRSVSALLRMQMEHLYQAEQRLPSKYRTDIYVNAIKTEGEAARYIRKATEAIHAAHAEAARARKHRPAKRSFELAARAAKTTRTKLSRPRKKSTGASGVKSKRKK